MWQFESLQNAGKCHSQHIVGYYFRHIICPQWELPTITFRPQVSDPKIHYNDCKLWFVVHSNQINGWLGPIVEVILLSIRHQLWRVIGRIRLETGTWIPDCTFYRLFRHDLNRQNHLKHYWSKINGYRNFFSLNFNEAYHIWVSINWIKEIIIASPGLNYWIILI